MDIEKIKKSIKKKFFYTHHSIKKLSEKDISVDELRNAIESGEIIQEFPRDKYGPCSLIFGFTNRQRPIHAIVSYSEPAWVIMAYEPQIEEWINFRERKQK